MAFNFGGSFNTGAGFSGKPTPANPLDSVVYTDNLQADSLAELDALHRAMSDAPPEYLVVMVFPARADLDDFMWRRHLPKDSRFVEGEKALRCMSTPPAAPQFSPGGGFSFKPVKQVDADEGWVQRARGEKTRFALATDPEYYCVVSCASDPARQDFLSALGLDGLTPLDVPGGVFLSGPDVDSVLG